MKKQQHKIRERAVSNGLMKNKSKTKYTKINKNTTNFQQDMIMNGELVEEVQNVRYLGALINSKKLVVMK